MKLLRILFRPDDDEPDLGESRVEEIAAQKVKSDSTLARVERVLSAPDARIQAAIGATASAAQIHRRRRAR